jgi:hypothetical protein
VEFDMGKAKDVAVALGLSALLSGSAYAADKFHCEAKDGKADLKDAKNRKDCNAKGGKWVKGHGHEHASGESAHEHDGEGAKKEEKKK